MMGYVFMRFGTAFQPENVNRLREKVGECLNRAGFSGAKAFALLNLMDELICNILEHGNASWVELELHPLQDKTLIIFRDDGTSFDPTPAIQNTAEIPDTENFRNLGLYMVGKIAKSWEYQRSASQVNELKLTVAP